MAEKETPLCVEMGDSVDINCQKDGSIVNGDEKDDIPAVNGKDDHSGKEKESYNTVGHLVAETHDTGTSNPADTGARPKRPPRSERKRMRHEELLVRRKEERKKKKMERKARLKEERKQDSNDNSDRKSKRELKEEQRQRCQQAMVDGQKICIDCSMEHLMSDKEKGKLAMQIGRLYGSNLKADNPVHIYLTGLHKRGQLYQECVRKMDGFESYMVERKEESHTELFPLDDVVYLSPDSDNLLSDIEPDKVYVIGGLVDENIKQCITKSRASEAKIVTARLPIEEYMMKIDQASHSKVLAVNQVFDILLTYMTTKDWKQSLSAGVPRRKGYVVLENGNT